MRHKEETTRPGPGHHKDTSVHCPSSHEDRGHPPACDPEVHRTPSSAPRLYSLALVFLLNETYVYKPTSSLEALDKVKHNKTDRS